MYFKKISFICSFLLISVILFSFSVNCANKPGIQATAAVVIDKKTGQVLYDKNMNIHRPPASTTKILTAIAAIEEGNLDDVVTVSRKAAYQEGSSIYLEPDEKITLRELLYGILLASGNDAAVAIAEHISGSVDKFAKLMMKKAQEIGATNSNFLNPSGLPQAGHYSSAYDLAMIMRYALKNKTFAKITATKNKTISWGKNDWGRGLRNHNELLWSYDGITGGKTGYTRAAGRCLVTSARRNGREVIAVVLNSPSDWMECSQLMDYGLDNFKNVKVVNKGDSIYTLDWEDAREKKLELVAKKPIYMTVPSGQDIKIKKKIQIYSDLQLPINKGDLTGDLEILYNDKSIGKTDLIANDDLNFDSLFMRLWYKITVIFEKTLQKTGIKLSFQNLL